MMKILKFNSILSDFIPIFLRFGVMCWGGTFKRVSKSKFSLKSLIIPSMLINLKSTMFPKQSKYYWARDGN